MSFLAGHPQRSTSSAVTYRHLLSASALTVHNPLRTIAHCDIDAAYAQFEQVRLGLADDIPLICAQWQSLIAVNYPARKYGIKRFNTIDEAKKMCPHLVVQHVATYRDGESEPGYWGEVDSRTHKVSLDPYRRESLKILAIFKEMIPKGEIEKASIDEAFIDLTPMVVDKLLQVHPHLATVPDDASDGLDTVLPPPPPIDWTTAGNVVPIDGEKPEVADGQMEQEVVTEHEDTWEDWALLLGAEIMADIRAEVYKRLHYTCSAGIAHNKAIAKLCSAWKKPNAQTVLRAAATPAFLRNMEFTDIRMLGGKLGTSIANEFGVKTVGDLLTIPLEDLQKRFGEESIWVYNIARGIDYSEVTARLATKSMLASKNTRPAVTTPAEGLHWIKILAGELCVRLRGAREVTPGIWPKTIALGYRTGIESVKHRQIPFPFSKNLNTEYIVRFAKKLWDEVCQPMSRGGMKLNNMSLTFSGLERLEEGQRGIEGFFGAASGPSANNKAPAPQSERPASPAPKTAGVKRSRSPSLQPSSRAPPPPPPTTSAQPPKRRLPILHTGKAKNPLAGFLVKNGESSKQSLPLLQPSSSKSAPAASSGEVISFLDDDEDEDIQEPAAPMNPTEYTCPRCKALLKIDPGPDEASRMKEVKAEHTDYHFALDLQNGPSPARGKKGKASGAGNAPIEKAKKKPKKPEGIKAFFAPRPAGKGG